MTPSPDLDALVAQNEARWPRLTTLASSGRRTHLDYRPSAQPCRRDPVSNAPVWPLPVKGER